MKRWAFWLLCVSFFMLFLGCSDVASDDSTRTQLSSIVSFGLGGVQAAKGVAESYTPPDAVFYFDITRASHDQFQPDTMQLPADPTEPVSIVLPKDGLYLIGFLSNYFTPRTAKSIAGATSSMGGLQIVTCGLDTVPLSAQASDEIDLGSLLYDGDGFTSSIDPLDASGYLGYSIEQLGSLGIYDETLRKFYNTDINSDGAVDWDQGLHWDFRFVYKFTETNGTIPLDFSFSTLNIRPSDLQPDDRFYVLDVSYLGDLAPEIQVPASSSIDVSLMFPGTAVSDVSGIITELSGTMFQYQDRRFQSQFHSLQGIISPSVPFDSDFELVAQDKTYRFNRISFIQPDNNFEGFLHPFYKLDVAEDGTLRSISWEIMIARQNRFVPIAIEEFKRLWNGNGQMVMYVNDNGIEKGYGFNGALLERTSGTDDLTSSVIMASDITGISLFFEDRGKTVYEFMFNHTDQY